MERGRSNWRRGHPAFQGRRDAGLRWPGAALAETGDFSAAIDAAEQALTTVLSATIDALADAVAAADPPLPSGLAVSSVSGFLAGRAAPPDEPE